MSFCFDLDTLSEEQKEMVVDVLKVKPESKKKTFGKKTFFKKEDFVYPYEIHEETNRVYLPYAWSRSILQVPFPPKEV
jgi:hypothetical protein